MRFGALTAAAAMALSVGFALAEDPKTAIREASRAAAEADEAGRTEDARALHERAVALAGADLPGSILEANAIDGLAFHLLASGDPEAAIPWYERGLALYRALLAGDQSRIATSLHNLAVAEDRAGRTEAAAAHAREALGSWSRLPPERRHGEADTLQLLANLARRAGHVEEAAALDERSRAARGEARR